MIELKKPTIEGLIEKLVSGKFIKSDESTAVEKLLGQATEKMSKDEISSIVTKLNDKLDATSSEILTSTGTLNYSVFESEVKKATQVIIKNKEEQKSQQAKAAELERKIPTDEKKNEGKKEGQAEEQAEREATIRNMNSIGNLFRQFPEFSKFEFPKEDLEVLGEAKTKFDKAIKKAEELMQENSQLSQEEAFEKASQEYEIDMSSGEMQIAMGTSFAERVEEMSQKENITRDEAMERLIGANANIFGFFFRKNLEEAKKAGKKLTFRGLVGKTLSAGAQKYFDDKSKEKNSEIESLEKDGWYLNLQDLKDCIAAKEEAERCFTWWRNLNVHKDEIALDYAKLAEKYLCTDQSVSQIFEQLKKEDPNLDLKFNDVLNGIIENIKTRSESPDLQMTLSDIRRTEESRRVYEQFMKSLNVAKSYAKEVGGVDKDQNDRIIEELEKSNISNLESIKKVKEFWIQRTKIDVDNYREENPEVLEESKPSNEKKIKTFEKDRDRIIRDRNQIIKLSKDLGISTDEAAKRYFEENPKRLKQYGIKERRILLGKNNKSIEELELSFVLKKFGSFIKNINKRIISIAEVDKVLANKRIARVKGDIDKPYELEKAIEDLAKAEERIQKCGKINALLERGNKKKDASELLDDKIKKEREKEIFKDYLMSGKSATEILKELNKDGNEYSINDVIKIITEGARNHLKKNELKLVIASEKAIYNRTNELELMENSKKNAEEKGLTDWVNDYEEYIKNIQEKLEFHQNRKEFYKMKMQKRMGILDPNQILEERRKLIENSKNQEEFSEERNASQETQTDSPPKSGLEFGSIKTGGKKHNVRAIAQKGKVTPKGIKGMFAKIKSLYRDPKKSKQEEAKGIQDEKTTTTSSDGTR